MGENKGLQKERLQQMLEDRVASLIANRIGEGILACRLDGYRIEIELNRENLYSAH